MQIQASSFIQQIYRRRIATWNGVTIEACPYQERSTDRILSSNFHVFRVPIVEYFPYVVKHKWPHIDAKCPVNSLPCYGQRTNDDNSTVRTVNYFCANLCLVCCAFSSTCKPKLKKKFKPWTTTNQIPILNLNLNDYRKKVPTCFNILLGHKPR